MVCGRHCGTVRLTPPQISGKTIGLVSRVYDEFASIALRLEIGFHRVKLQCRSDLEKLGKPAGQPASPWAAGAAVWIRIYRKFGPPGSWL